MEVASWLSVLECEMGFAFRVIHYFVLGRTFPVVSWLERSKEEPAHCFCRDQCDGYSLANRSPRTWIWLEVASLALGKDEGHSKAREMQLNLQGNFICLAYLKLSMKLAVYHRKYLLPWVWAQDALSEEERWEKWVVILQFYKGPQTNSGMTLTMPHQDRALSCTNTRQGLYH